ncbi:helix-turn-helix transcriptional regulator [Streptomyces sp. NPDC005774]|uniref:helix-turn-helix domain-containing protein n=1 Tax=Streptomyces sp. NPDC005774 TaxID=3364728 RepID=UPI003692E896
MTGWDTNELTDRAGLAIPSEEDNRTKSTVAPSDAGTTQDAANRLRVPQDLNFDQPTDRERQVLALLTDGPSNHMMARRLGTAKRTVKAHLTNLMRKLGIQTRLAAALLSNLHSEGISLGEASSRTMPQGPMGRTVFRTAP